MVKSTGCSCIEPRFGSQDPHGSTQPSATPVPGDLTPLLVSTGTSHSDIYYENKQANVSDLHF